MTFREIEIGGIPIRRLIAGLIVIASVMTLAFDMSPGWENQAKWCSFIMFLLAIIQVIL